METFSADSDDGCVWELVSLLLVKFSSRFELCVVIQTNVAQFLYDIWNYLLSAVAVKQYPRSVRIFIKYSARSRPATRRMARGRA